MYLERPGGCPKGTEGTDLIVTPNQGQGLFSYTCPYCETNQSVTQSLEKKDKASFETGTPKILSQCTKCGHLIFVKFPNGYKELTRELFLERINSFLAE